MGGVHRGSDLDAYDDSWNQKPARHVVLLLFFQYITACQDSAQIVCTAIVCEKYPISFFFPSMNTEFYILLGIMVCCIVPSQRIYVFRDIIHCKRLGIYMDNQISIGAIRVIIYFFQLLSYGVCVGCQLPGIVLLFLFHLFQLVHWQLRIVHPLPVEWPSVACLRGSARGTFLGEQSLAWVWHALMEASISALLALLGVVVKWGGALVLDLLLY